MNKIPIVLTPGDPHGIGPEIAWKAICHFFEQSSGVQIICVGARQPFESLKANIKLVDKGNLIPAQTREPTLWLLPAPEKAEKTYLLEGYQAGWSIKTATQLVLDGFASALVTGPISKERLVEGGYSYNGHTEFLADLCQVQAVTMMLANADLRVALVTTHLALKEVSSALSAEKIKRAIAQTVQGLRQLWGIQKPKIAVLGLNPHSGEGGLFGKEELETIQPTLSELQSDSSRPYEISGPFPSDTFFALQRLRRYQFDAVICMYHDQGLIPVKLLDFYKTVNVTLGLPMIRTSVDHGVAFDIAGKGIADPSSLIAAIELATQFAQNKDVMRS